MIGECLAALDRLVDGSAALGAEDAELLAALEDELQLCLVGPGAEATPTAVSLAGPARKALRAVAAFFDDAEALAGDPPPAGVVLRLVRPARPEASLWRRPDAC